MNSATPDTKRGLLNAAQPPHARERWQGGGCKEILINGRLAVMKGTEEGIGLPKAKVAALYEAAKIHNDMDCAHQIVELMWRNAVYEELRNRVFLSGKYPIIVSPHPSFDDEDVIDHDAPRRAGPRNALPFAYAARLRIMLGGLEDPQLVQGARVGRTKLPRFPKFLFQPHFVGDVATDRPYILVDDTVGLGGTLAALYGHIARNGGTVIGVAALAHSTGKNVPLALTEGTHAALYEKYGPAVCALWKEKVGHESFCLTEGEGRFLIEWAPGTDLHGNPESQLHALRDRLDQARNTFK